ncbi:pentapeptide repeat-containing protein [Planobispora takensis]|uniref:Oxidoreductase n=1 Tax=Planobispora takensis TaxID=1367882 RepID=A0A8J3WTZ9_9ACTN|nr:pentapeptide repeat-containing protein [Planobispora takensis]GIH99406.1 oxidoreductase [Planobispora takensis]
MPPFPSPLSPASRGTRPDRRPRRLNPAERLLWEAYPTGAWVDLRTGDPAVDDPANGAAWGPERTVRAEVLTALLLGAREAEPGTTPGVRLAGARVTGPLDLSDATVTVKLHLLNCVIPDTVDFTDATTRGMRFRGCAMGRVRGARSTVDGLLEFDGSAVGGLRLDNAHITGQFRLAGTHLAPPAGGNRAPEAGPPQDITHPFTEEEVRRRGHDRYQWALWAGGLTVDGGAFLRRLRATGGLRMVGAKFHGGLYLQEASITATGPAGLPAVERVTGSATEPATGSTAEPATGSTADPAVESTAGSAADPAVESTADPAAAKVYAVYADFLESSAAEFSDGFTAAGTVRLRGARINGVLSFDRAVLKAPDRSLHLSHMQVDELILKPAAIEGEINLSYSRIGVLMDGLAAYPDHVHLNGLTYEALRGSWTVAGRLSWLCRDPGGYRPQPYEQLAAWYRRIGHEPDARRVLLAKQREHRATLRPTGRLWGRLLDAAVGYGYRPWMAGLWAAVLLVAGTAVFSAVPPAQIDPDEVRHFSAFVYTLDLLVPVSVFEQRGAWEPVGWTQWLAWTLVVSGWILATALIAGAARVLRPTSAP